MATWWWPVQEVSRQPAATAANNGTLLLSPKQENHSVVF